MFTSQRVDQRINVKLTIGETNPMFLIQCNLMFYLVYVFCNGGGFLSVKECFQ